MSEFLAEAQIVVRANTKPFVADFEKAVKSVEKVRVTIAVRASMTGFRADLIEKLAGSTKGLSVKVPVRADMTGFRADLQAKLQSSTKGLVANVNVRAGGVTQGAATAATGGGAAAAGRKAVTAEQAVANAVQAGVFARKQVTGLIDEQDKRLARIARQEAAIKVAQDAGTKAVLEQNAALQVQAATVERIARSELVVTRGAFEKEAARRTSRDPNVKAQAEKDAKDVANAELRAKEAVIDASRQAERNAADQKIRNQQVLVERLAKQESAAFAKQTNDRLNAEKRVADQIANIRTDIGDISPESLSATAGKEGAIRKQITVLTTAEKDAKKLLRKANIDGMDAEAAAIQGLVAETGELKRMAEASLVAAAHQTKLAHTFANVKRAAVAQIANLTGLRGAALTAATAFIATSAAILTLRKAVNIAAKLETELAVFQVTAGATAQQMDEVHDKAIALGRDITLPGVSAGDAAVALTELSKAGLSVQDSIDGAKGVLQLATAANIDFTQATNLTASALNAFGLAGDQASHVADVFANSANAAQGSITDVAVAMQQSSSVVRQAGISFEDGAAVLTLFARNGLRGSDAGTSLRTALIRLINPSKKAGELIQKLGLRIRDSQGAIDLGVFQQFADKTRDMSAAQRDQALAVIFGQDAIRAAGILVREGNRGLDEQRKNVEKAGTAAEVAAARTSGYAGALENLKNQIESVAEAVGSIFLPPLTAVINTLASTVSGVESLTESLNSLAKAATNPIKILIETIPGVNLEDPLFPSGEIVPKESLTGAEHATNTFKAIFLGNWKDISKQFGEDVGVIKLSIAQMRANLENMTDLDFIASIPTPSQSIEKIQKITEEVNKANEAARASGPPGTFGGSPEAIERSIDALRKLQAQLEPMAAAGDVLSKNLVKGIQDYIDIIQEASTKRVTPTLEIPGNLRSVSQAIGDEFSRMSEEERDHLKDVLGEGWKAAGLEGNVLFWDAFKGGLVPNATLAGAQAKNAFLTGFDPAAVGDIAQGEFFNHFTTNLDIQLAQEAKNQADAFGKGAKKWWHQMSEKVKTAVATAKNQVLGTERAQTVAQINDDPTGEIKALRDREMVLRRGIARIDAAQQRGEPIAGGLEARSRFRERLEATIEERKAIEEGIKSDAKKAADDLKKKQDEADKAFLDALARGRTPFERRIARAEETEGEDDNITALQAFRKRLFAEVAAVKKGVKDAKTRTTELDDLSDELFQNGQDIAAAKKRRDEAIQEILAEKGQALVSLGETTGNTKLIIKGLDIQIADAKEILAKAIKAKLGQIAAAAALAALQKTKRDTIQSARDALLGAAFDVAEAKGNKSLMLQILDLQIDEAKREITRAKTLVDRLIAQAKMQNLINKKKEIIAEEAKKADDKQGTTVFDLLKQNVDVFNKSAGNLIGQNQPFAGAFGFTADIAGFLTRRKNAAIGGGGAGGGGINPFEQPLFRGGTFASRGKDLTSQLIDALKGLTEATLSGASEAKKSTSASAGRSPLTDKALMSFKQLFVVGKPKGLVEAGNIDVLHRPRVAAPEGGIATVRSITVGIEHGMAAVIPTVLGKGKNARVVSVDEAKKHFRDTGENLGIFSSEKAANVYARALHLQQERMGGLGQPSTSQARVADSNERLIQALDRNTASHDGGNTSTSGVTPGAKVKGHPWAGRPWFWAANTAKQSEEA